VSRPHLLVILASVRQGRGGERVAAWFRPIVEARSDLTWELADLRDHRLPYYSSARHPPTPPYRGRVAAWASVVGRADAYVVITPEYNGGYPAVLKTAIDALYHEWRFKPIAFVSYGGRRGGSAAAQQLREVAIEVDLVPIRRGVSIQYFGQAMGADGSMAEPVLFAGVANQMLDDLAHWARGLQAGLRG
jgi:NAD(P)H-dependent FMN reductase